MASSLQKQVAPGISLNRRAATHFSSIKLEDKGKYEVNSRDYFIIMFKLSRYIDNIKKLKDQKEKSVIYNDLRDLLITTNWVESPTKVAEVIAPYSILSKYISKSIMCKFQVPGAASKEFIEAFSYYLAALAVQAENF